MPDLKRVRDAADWEALHALRRRTLFPPGRRETAYDENHPDDRAPGNQVFLLVLDGEPIGTARLDEGDGIVIVRLVAIRPDRQRRGYGRVLDGLLTQEAERMGAATMLVNAAPDAVGFYEKAGWRRSARDPAAFRSPEARVVRMEKRLT